MTEIRAERLHAAVRSTPMFRGLADSERDRIQTLCSLRDYARGEELWHAGDAADALTLIVHGRVKIVRHASTGDVILEIFGEGEPVGAIAVYHGMPYPASAVTMEPVTILRLPKSDFFDLLEREPAIARALLRELTKLNLALVRKLEEIRGLRVETRIAALFVSLAERLGRATRDGTEVPLKLSRQEVAAMVGTTVETAIRVMSQWGREGLVVTGEGRFVIPSLERLRQVAGGPGTG
ncbi:MAG: Crp/Fnr family transcriptional regulator [Candidatus Eisenbacteria bacterium]